MRELNQTHSDLNWALDLNCEFITREDYGAMYKNGNKLSIDTLHVAMIFERVCM